MNKELIPLRKLRKELWGKSRPCLLEKAVTQSLWYSVRSTLWIAIAMSTEGVIGFIHDEEF